MQSYVARTWGWDEAVQRRMFRERFYPSKIEVFECDGEPIGMCSLAQEDDAVLLAGIEIFPAWQGRGFGTAIVTELIRSAARVGRVVRLRVLKVNPARRLYERLGLEVVGETPTHFLMQTRRE